MTDLDGFVLYLLSTGLEARCAMERQPDADPHHVARYDAAEARGRELLEMLRRFLGLAAKDLKPLPPLAAVAVEEKPAGFVSQGSGA